MGIQTEMIIGATKRYKKFYSIRSNKLFALPLTNDIFEKIAKQLNFTEASFAMGDYVGTIALCGMLSEMTILMCYDMIEIMYRNRLYSFSEKPIKYEKFERYGQAKREEYIDKFLDKKEIVNLSKSIREIRNKYLHYFKMEYSTLESDSEEAYENIIDMLKIVTGLGISKTRPGAIALDPNFLHYIKLKGFDKN